MRPRSGCRRPCTRWRRGKVADGGRATAGPGALSSMRLLFATAAEGDRTGLLTGLVMLAVANVLQPLFPLLFGRLVDAVTRDSPDVGAAAVAGAAIALTSAGAAAGINYSQMFLWNVWERMTITIDEQLVRLTG